jgi:hypothetical protein
MNNCQDTDGALDERFKRTGRHLLPHFRHRCEMLRRLGVVRAGERLDQLSGRLGDADWARWTFRTGDLMMVLVLLRLKSSGILDEYPNAYVARGQARPA